MFQNMDKYLIIILLVVVLVVLMRMNNMMTAQTQLMLSMASKLGLEPLDMDGQNKESDNEEDQEEKQEEEENDTNNGGGKDEELTEEQKKQQIEETMVQLSTKIVKGVSLKKKEKEFYSEFFSEMEERLQLVKMQEINNDNPKHSKRLSEEERDEIYLSFFQDEKPKALKNIIALYAAVTGNEPSQGNTHGHLKKLIEKKKISVYSYKLKNEVKPKIYYGLITWFDGKKMKKEFIDNIA